MNPITLTLEPKEVLELYEILADSFHGPGTVWAKLVNAIQAKADSEPEFEKMVDNLRARRKGY